MNEITAGRDVAGTGEAVRWRVTDLIGGDKQLDFAQAFLPEPLAGTAPLAFLVPGERLVLNQIRAHGYLHFFTLAESFILPFVLDHARPRLQDETGRVRALLQFASEEAKHLQLFRRFRRTFLAGFGHPCAAVGPVRTLAQKVLSHHPLAVALISLHLECSTQAHYLDSVRAAAGLDPLFVDLLKHHWLDEAQHVPLDAQMVRTIAESCSVLEIAEAIDEYFAIIDLLDGALVRQVALDLDTFQQATGRALSRTERAAFRTAQERACRDAFLCSGMAQPLVQDVFAALQPGAAERLAAAAARLS
jgi:hypothetical protein